VFRDENSICSGLVSRRISSELTVYLGTFHGFQLISNTISGGARYSTWERNQTQLVTLDHEIEILVVGCGVRRRPIHLFVPHVDHQVSRDALWKNGWAAVVKFFGELFVFGPFDVVSQSDSNAIGK